jgi:hypothetical protein
VKKLFMKNAKVYLAARSPEKAAAAIKRLEEETKKPVIFLQLDPADLSSMRKAAETFLSQESRLNERSVRECSGRRLSFNGWFQRMVCPADQLFRSSVHSRLSADPGWFFEVLANTIVSMLKTKVHGFPNRKNSKVRRFYAEGSRALSENFIHGILLLFRIAFGDGQKPGGARHREIVA